MIVGKKMAKGVFFSLDGLDGCGKSTQMRLLAEALEKMGYSVVTCVDPGGTEIGKTLRQILLHHKGLLGMRSEALLFMASRAQLVDEIIAPSLEQGKIVISDRYLLANLVYQGYGGGLNLEDLRATGNLSTGGVLPNLTFVLDIPVEIARKRIQRPADRMEQRPDSFFEKVRQGFLTEAALAEDRMMVINASESIEIIQGKVFSKVKELLGGGEIS